MGTAFSPTYNCSVCGKDLGEVYQATCGPKCDAVAKAKAEVATLELLSLNPSGSAKLVFQSVLAERNALRDESEVLRRVIAAAQAESAATSAKSGTTETPTTTKEVTQ